jgi:predicted aminopeptidase
VVGLLLAARGRLAEVYASAQPEEWKRRRKVEVLAELREAYRELSAGWSSRRYDGWFGAGLNNARLASIGAYHELVPAFEALLARLDGDFARFHAEVRRLARLPFDQRRRELSVR